MTLFFSIVLVVVNGVFVGFEFALLASMRSRIEELSLEGGVARRSALTSMGQVGVMLAGAQLGITLASLGLGAIAEPAVAHLLEPLAEAVGLPETSIHTVALIVALSIVVFAHMVIGEMVPKNIALAAPERTLLALSPAMAAFVFVFRPVITSLNYLGNLGARAIGIEPTDELNATANAAEFEVMLGESRAGGLLEDDEHELLVGALAFRDRTVIEVMVPLASISSLGYRSTIAEFEKIIVDSGHSRIVVTGSRRDDLVGFVHAKDLLRFDLDRRADPLPLTLCRPTFSVSADRLLGDVLLEMRRSRRHIAWVVGVDNGVVGMVTMEDILEQIVGDIVDETDRAVT